MLEKSLGSITCLNLRHKEVERVKRLTFVIQELAPERIDKCYSSPVPGNVRLARTPMNATKLLRLSTVAIVGDDQGDDQQYAFDHYEGG